ncbi:HSP20 family protein [Chryseobacterium defluvii]|uniref:HSP20 family protein n=1 Tax=Chryseobacterium defluvii TaxID=160396 RepID=A0A840KEB4_9FLAO|nr:Hsp20/alpha crystallin family protein [Chryseobacterium defluvii]MBB4805883.1 HSP20 family protein [Chryseobacterium defluvii]
MYTQDKAQGPFGKQDKYGGFERGKFGKFKDHFGGYHPFKEMFAKKMSSHKPVNITEHDNDFTIRLYAGGLDKSLFKIAVKDQVLTLSYTNEEDYKNEHMIYQEFYPNSFERRFQLTEKVLEDQISASYDNGILTVVLPKNPEKNKPSQAVEVN